MARALKPLFVNVTWGAGGSTASKSLALAEVCQRQLGLTTCLHLTCTNMSRKLVDSALSEARALGIRNILALRGDPPRSEEYRENQTNGHAEEDEDDSNKDFNYAVDLVRYIRKEHGDYFCIGVAAYPEGFAEESHPAVQDPAQDLPYLIEKTKAGADFLMTQLFFDVDAYVSFEKMLRNDPSGVFKTIPIIPGLMPIQSYQILRRVTKLSHAKLPDSVSSRLDAVKGDDSAIKAVGVEILSEIISTIKSTTESAKGPRGFHFYTLNLEKAVSQVLESSGLLSSPEESESDSAIEETPATASELMPPGHHTTRERRRLSSANAGPFNRVIVERAPSSSARSRTSRNSFEIGSDEAGIPSDKQGTRASTLAISEGEGALGREATWDDFPNGRWGDSRSPAYGEIDGYGISLHASPKQAIALWGRPRSNDDITKLFVAHIDGSVPFMPWSEEPMGAETRLIQRHLRALNQRGWWTIASQPAVNGVRSSDPTVGWGPKQGGFVFQKPFVEMFVPAAEYPALKRKLQDLGGEDVTFFAATAAGDVEASDESAVCPVTWGAFYGKEIVTPTIIERESFSAWAEDAFQIWRVWGSVFGAGEEGRTLRKVAEETWLVTVVGHDFVNQDRLWGLLLED
jgi:methylenetetrahydrofolate reductase (NADPH)